MLSPDSPRFVVTLQYKASMSFLGLNMAQIYANIHVKFGGTQKLIQVWDINTEIDTCKSIWYNCMFTGTEISNAYKLYYRYNWFVHANNGPVRSYM